MDADIGRYVMLMGLEVVDETAYARYRSEMAPILEAHGGAFDHDFVVARVLQGDPRINRVFAISFPDPAGRERFFADERYRGVRAEHFDPAVATVVLFAAFKVPAAPAPSA